MARVLLLTHIYPPAVDGGSKVIAKMGEYLEKNDHQLLIVTSNCTSTDDFVSTRRSRLNFDKDGQNIIRLPVITLFHRPLKLFSKLFPNIRPFSKGPIFSYLPFQKIISFKPDYIMAGPLPTTIVLYARILRYLTKSKLIINASFHPHDPDFQSPILLSTLKSADYIWTLTDYETNYFHRKLNIPLNRLVNLGNGVDKSFLLSTPPLLNYSTSNLLYVGSFSAHKNLNTLIKAFSLLPKTFTLTLAGQKTLYYPEIQSQISTLSPQISSRIKFIFSFSDSKLATLIDNSNILISPSLQESFGLVLIEAMARGKPVIAADIPASAELIKKSQAGLTFSSLDPQDLSKKILKLTQNIKLNQKLALNGLKYVSKHYTWDKIGENLCKKLVI